MTDPRRIYTMADERMLAKQAELNRRLARIEKGGATSSLTRTAPLAHSATHATNGDDPLSPDLIGAAHSNDARFPSTDEKAALAGTNGTPSTSNKFVTNSDPRLTAGGTPDHHASTHAADGADPITPVSILAPKIYHDQLIGDGETTEWTVTHALGTRYVLVQCFVDEDTYASQTATITRTTTNTVTVSFASAPAYNKLIGVVVHGSALAPHVQPIVATDAYPTTVLADTPSYYWRFRETSGSTAADTSGNAHSGEYFGGITLGAQGPVHGGKAIICDGSSGYFRAAGGLNSSGSIEVWFKTSEAGTIFGGSNQYGSQTAPHSHDLIVLGDGRLLFYVYSGDAIASTASVDDNQWHHAVVTWVSGGQQKLYLDGSLVATGSNDFTWSGATYLFASPETGGGISGSWPDGVSALPKVRLNGAVAEIAVYESVLTAGRISAHYDAK